MKAAHTVLYMKNTMVVFKMRDSVPSARYSSVCNVLRQWNIPLIPTYRVYRLYDIIIYTVQKVSWNIAKSRRRLHFSMEKDDTEASPGNICELCQVRNRQFFAINTLKNEKIKSMQLKS